ncbi:CinA family protein [Helicobacter mesocricetorum]|uniref:CinA family protein n=1 Tax=Helicobacter mesocricetorum TaxID=87012 RepID=UPI000CF0A175|nr:CinA family protein [Helicobacter mesocricetorum]
MNSLFCVGEKFYTLKPLRDFSIRYGEEIFGKIHKIIFSDLDPMDFDALRFVLQSSKQCLILSPKGHFPSILEWFHQNYRVSIQEEVDTYKVFYGEKKIFLQDYPKNSEDFLGICNKYLVLFLLGLDCKSALELLKPTMRTFKVDLEIMSDFSGLEILVAKNGDLENFLLEVNSIFRNKIIPSFNLAKTIIHLLKTSCQKVTTAESCTGGLLAYYLTKESGASEVFDGGVISYANIVKESWLKVSSNSLMSFGAVSEMVVREMLDGALEISSADFAIATSGIAGPNGGSINKPVGLVFIGVKSKSGKEVIESVLFKGDRNYIQEQACLYAYGLFLKVFLEVY